MKSYLMDRVYEREVATLEFTSGSSDEEETLLPPLAGGATGSGSGKGSSLSGKNSLVFHHIRTPPTGSGHGNHATFGGGGSKRFLPSETEAETGEADAEDGTEAGEPEGEGEGEGEDSGTGTGAGEEDGRQVEDSMDDGDRLHNHHHHHNNGTMHQRDGHKKKRVVKSAEAAAATPRKALAVPTDDQGNPLLPLTVGVITLHSLGCVIWDRPAFHNKRYIWPPGYHTSRPYNSCIDADAQTVYHSTILDGGSGPIFDVYADDNLDQHFQAPTPTGAWTAIVKQVNALRGREYTNSASGPDFFGLSNSTISMLIERLPEAERCTHYQRKTFSTVPMTAPGMTNPNPSSSAMGIPTAASSHHGSIPATSLPATPPTLNVPSSSLVSSNVPMAAVTLNAPNLPTPVPTIISSASASASAPAPAPAPAPVPVSVTNTMNVALPRSSLDILSSAATLPSPPPPVDHDLDLDLDEPTN